MATKIRPYRERDTIALVTCLKELQQYVASLDERKQTRSAADFDGEAYTRRLLEKVRTQSGAIYVADDGSHIVGCIAGVIPEQTEDDLLEDYPSKDGRILELYVRPDQSGKQIGRGLMRAMEQYFRDAGCKGCLVDCFAPNTAAHAFYLKLGYADRMTTLLKLL